MNAFRHLTLAALLSVSVTACTPAQHSSSHTFQPKQNTGSFLTDPLTITKLESDIWVFSGAGGNITAVQSPSGTLLVDSGVAERAEEIEGTLRAKNALPVTTVIDTHYHDDHTGGNAHFAARDAVVIAHENVRRRLEHGYSIDFFDKQVLPAPAAALPSMVFANRLDIDHGARRLQVIHSAGNAHTDGDSFVRLREDDIIAAGDLVGFGRYPFIDYSAGGSINGVLAHVERILAVSGDETRIIPGHGYVGSRADLVEYRNMLIVIRDRISGMLDDGYSEEEIVAAKPTAEFDRKWGQGMFSGEDFTRIVTRGFVNAPYRTVHYYAD